MPGGRGGAGARARGPEQRQPSLDDEAIDTLVKWGLSLERYFKRPQEIEWAMDDAGRLWLLQSRVCRFPGPPCRRRKTFARPAPSTRCSSRTSGVVAHAGVGSGVGCLRASDVELRPLSRGRRPGGQIHRALAGPDCAQGRGHRCGAGLRRRASGHHRPGIPGAHPGGGGGRHGDPAGGHEDHRGHQAADRLRRPGERTAAV